MTSGKRVSAIVPVYDRVESLSRAVESLLETRYDDLEVVIVDDGSGPETRAQCRELERRYSGVVRVVRHVDGRNHGPGPSRNLGVREASGEYVCFLDSDDYVFPHRFECCVEILDLDSSVDGVYEWTQTEIVEGGEWMDRHVPDPTPYEKGKNLLEAILASHVYWSVNSILLRKQAFEDVGGFSAQLRSCEDRVLWLKLAATKHLVPGADKPVAAYRLHGRNSRFVQEATARAALEVLEWGRMSGMKSRDQALLRRHLRGKLRFVLDRLRRKGRSRVAARLLLESLAQDPGFVTTAFFWKNLGRTTVESLGWIRHSSEEKGVSAKVEQPSTRGSTRS